jgi:hypothetical protein
MRIDENGVHLHQSDLKNHCLEKLRLETVAVGPRVENDAATVGTTLHSVIEHELRNGPCDNEFHCEAVAANLYLELLEQYQAEGRPYALSSFGSHDRAISQLVGVTRAWYRSTERQQLLNGSQLPQVEWNFDLPFCEVEVKKFGKRAEIVPVWLAGTADIVMPNAVWDWKTAGSEYRRWEYQRWGRQPDVYTWAASQAGLLEPDPNTGLYVFEFKVFVRGTNPDMGCQTVSVDRSPNNWGWLQQIVSRLVNFSYNMGLDREWPLDDQHVLCSPKWCTLWGMCKGSQVDGGTWV